MLGGFSAVDGPSALVVISIALSSHVGSLSLSSKVLLSTRQSYADSHSFSHVLLPGWSPCRVLPGCHSRRICCHSFNGKVQADWCSDVDCLGMYSAYNGFSTVKNMTPFKK